MSEKEWIPHEPEESKKISRRDFNRWLAGGLAALTGAAHFQQQARKNLQENPQVQTEKINEAEREIGDMLDLIDTWRGRPVRVPSRSEIAMNYDQVVLPERPFPGSTFISSDTEEVYAVARPGELDNASSQNNGKSTLSMDSTVLGVEPRDGEFQVDLWDPAVMSTAYDYVHDSVYTRLGLTDAKLKALLYALKDVFHDGFYGHVDAPMPLEHWSNDRFILLRMLITDYSEERCREVERNIYALQNYLRKPGQSVAYVGEGTGVYGFAHARWMREHGDGTEHLKMQDINPDCIEWWEHCSTQEGYRSSLRGSQTIEFVQGTEDDLGIQEASVDVIYAANVFNFVWKQHEKAPDGSGGPALHANYSQEVLERGAKAWLTSAAKALKPGGKLIMSTHHWWGSHPVGGTNAGGFLNALSPKELANDIRELGLPFELETTIESLPAVSGHSIDRSDPDARQYIDAHYGIVLRRV